MYVIEVTTGEYSKSEFWAIGACPDKRTAEITRNDIKDWCVRMYDSFHFAHKATRTKTRWQRLEIFDGICAESKAAITRVFGEIEYLRVDHTTDVRIREIVMRSAIK